MLAKPLQKHHCHCLYPALIVLFQKSLLKVHNTIEMYSLTPVSVWLFTCPTVAEKISFCGVSLEYPIY